MVFVGVILNQWACLQRREITSAPIPEPGICGRAVVPESLRDLVGLVTALS